MKKREQLGKIALMLRVMNEKLTNKDLHDYIFDKFNCIADNTFKLKDSELNEIKAYDKKNNINFEIKFYPNIEDFSRITTSYSHNNQHMEEKEIIFDNEKITVNHSESTINIYDPKNISSINKITTKNEYINNELIYSYYFKSNTGTTLNFKTDGARVETIYVLPDKTAVKVTCTTSEDRFFETTGIKCYKIENINGYNFDTTVNRNIIIEKHIETITNEECQQLIENWKKAYTNKTKKKENKPRIS